MSFEAVRSPTEEEQSAAQFHVEPLAKLSKLTKNDLKVRLWTKCLHPQAHIISEVHYYILGEGNSLVPVSWRRFSPQ